MNTVTPNTLTPAVTPPVRNPFVGFKIHFTVYAVVVGLLAVLNLYLGEPYWVLYVLGGWGIGIVGHALLALLKRSSARA